MPLYPVANYTILVFFAFVLVVLALNVDTRIALCVTPLWFVMLHVVYKGVSYKKENSEACTIDSDVTES
jgi:D-serine/D-alanine/glycine transporter